MAFLFFKEGQVMSKIKDVQIEYDRLRSLFSSVDPTKAELVDNLINEAAFMRVAARKPYNFKLKSMVQFKSHQRVHKDKQKRQSFIRS